MKAQNIALLLCAGWLAGCATNPIPPVATHVDQFSGLRTDFIPNNPLAFSGPVHESISLNAARVFKNRQDFEYYLEVQYKALEETGFLNIKPGQSLVIVTDGQEQKFNGNGSFNTRQRNRGEVYEVALYHVGPDDLRKVANAKEVKVKVIGDHGIVEREFAPENFERFKKFVVQFVDGGA